MAKKKFTTFAEVCAATGRIEADFVIPETASNEDKAAICQKRTRLIAKAYNGKDKPRIADTSQEKYYIWCRVVQDDSKPAVLGLSLYDVHYSFTSAVVGSRPAFIRENDAREAFKQFTSEFEQQAQYEDLVNQED